MKILYAALKHDPTNPDLASGVDHHFYSAFCKLGADVTVVGPFNRPPVLPERLVRKLHRKIRKTRSLKWDVTTMWRASRELNRVQRVIRPDVVFSIFPPPLAGYTGSAPCVFNTDTTFQGWQDGGAGFGRVALRVLTWVETRAIARSSKILVFSDWCRSEIMRRHHIDARKILVHPMPCALPAEVIPGRRETVRKPIKPPIRLLLVGRDWVRKGISTAAEVSRLLNDCGIPTELTVCGVSGKESDSSIKFVGPFRKSIPEELARYASLYRSADFLIHPAVFDPSPIVPAEAAAFAVPTITNNVGGISTSVKHMVTGVVLPARSGAQSYVEVIKGLVANPGDYAALSRGARFRYEREQNWEVVGRWAMEVLESVVGKPAK